MKGIKRTVNIIYTGLPTAVLPCQHNIPSAHHMVCYDQAKEVFIHQRKCDHPRLQLFLTKISIITSSVLVG